MNRNDFHVVYAIKEDLKPAKEADGNQKSKEIHKQLSHWGANTYALKMLDFMNIGYRDFDNTLRSFV